MSVLVRRHYKFQTDLNVTEKFIEPYTATLYTGSGSSFTGRTDQPKGSAQQTGPPQTAPSIRDTNHGPLYIMGRVRLLTLIGDDAERVNIYFSEGLGAPVILSCDCCNEHVHFILPR